MDEPPTVPGWVAQPARGAADPDPRGHDSTQHGNNGSMPPGDDRSTLELLYRHYNERCNDHQFDQLGDFVAVDVEVNGEVQGLSAYVAGLQAVIGAFPDYRWNLCHLLVDSPWISAHFLDTGTHSGTFLDLPATERAIKIQEFATYRVDGGKIVEVWVTADNFDLLRQLR